MMDSFLLLFVSLFLRQPTTFLKILAASAAGSVYCCIYTVLAANTGSLFEGNIRGMLGIMQSIASTIISYVLLCMLMIFLAFGIHNKHILMKNIAVLYGAALFTGGVFSFLGNLVTPNNHLFYKAKEAAKAWNFGWAWAYFAVFSGIAFLAGMAVIRGWHRWQNISGNLYDISLEFGEKKLRLKVLLDTGNQLYEPVHGRPVTIIEKSAMDEIFEDTDWREKTGDILSVSFHTVGKENGRLKALVADTAIICQENKVWQYVNAVIGIYPGRFSQAGEYRGILHPAMLGDASVLCSRKKNFHP